jgi:hypothetical protein
MRRALALAGTAVALGCLAVPAPAGAATAEFEGSISIIRKPLRKNLISWRPGCPVHVKNLRLVTVTHWGFDGKPRTGKLVVHGDAAADIVTVMRRLYQARFPIRRMRLVDAYGADDYRSIEADNTSAFNCRTVGGTTRWSEHAYGLAIDINPIENPYVSGGTTSHPASRPYLDRSRRKKGMIHAGDAVVRAFASIGWGWGGYWSGVKDYQHFSASGS